MRARGSGAPKPKIESMWRTLYRSMRMKVTSFHGGKRAAVLQTREASRCQLCDGHHEDAAQHCDRVMVARPPHLPAYWPSPPI